jgi:hypothetical protein
MRNGLMGLIGLASAMALASLASGSCSSSDSSGGAGSAGTGGTMSAGGSSNSGGTAGSSAGGGGGADSGTASVTTLSGTKTISALTTGEANQLCSDTYNYFRSAIPKPVTCKWKGLVFGASSSAPTIAMTQANCTSQESSCLQAADPWSINNGCDLPKPSCMATVAVYSACIKDEITAFIQTVNGLPGCAMLTSTSAIGDAQSNSNPPASCTSLTDMCPEITPTNPLTQ